MSSNKRNEWGHVELGFTIALLIIIGFIGWVVFHSKGNPVEMWRSWPWWAKGLSIIGPIAVLLIGGQFERARKWLKL